MGEGGSTTSVITSAVEDIIDSLTTAFTTSDLVTIVTKMVAAVAIYCVLWFSIRYIIRCVRSAVFRGRLRA